MRQADERKYKGGHKNGPSKAVKPGRYAGSFISLSPTKDEKLEVASIYNQGLIYVLGELCSLVEEGYKLSVKWHVGVSAFQATLTGLEEHEENSGVTMAAYHIDYEKALATLLWGCSTKFSAGASWADATYQTEISW